MTAEQARQAKERLTAMRAYPRKHPNPHQRPPLSALPQPPSIQHWCLSATPSITPQPHDVTDGRPARLQPGREPEPPLVRKWRREKELREAVKEAEREVGRAWARAPRSQTVDSPEVKAWEAIPFYKRDRPLHPLRAAMAKARRRGKGRGSSPLGAGRRRGRGVAGRAAFPHPPPPSKSNAWDRPPAGLAGAIMRRKGAQPADHPRGGNVMISPVWGSSEQACPGIHQLAALLEQVTTPVSPLSSAANRMSQRQLDSQSGEISALVGPV